MRLLLPEQVRYVQPCIPCGHHVSNQTQPFQSRPAVDFEITAAVSERLVPSATQQFLLLSENNVFSAGLLVSVVDEENLHLAIVATSLALS